MPASHKCTAAAAGVMRMVQSSVSTSASTGIVATEDDIFYVSAAGDIHHSEDDAFKSIVKGPVQVVHGWKPAANKLASLYVLKYGLDLADDEDLEVDVENPTDPDAVVPGSESFTKEEAEEHSKKFAVLRKRIAAWYCRKYRDVERNEKLLFAEILGAVLNQGSGFPRKSQPIHLDSRRYYDERVKAHFEKAWATEKVLEIAPEGEIKIRNETTCEVFNEEMEEFQRELIVAVEAEHVAAIRAWELMCAETPTNKTPAELNAALKNMVF
ncbi:hypothetical protein C8R46DRAFT_1214068 [Mycena filopes]|nr:hypothetical protein C8R46DRAFT_1214068 [Mycena filopes]